MKKTHIFYAHGMHCIACTLLIEETLTEVDGVTQVKAKLSKGRVEIEWDSPIENPIEIIETLNPHIQKHGYRLALEKQIKPSKLNEFFYAIPVAIAFFIGFLLLQKIGWINLISTEKMTGLTALFIGLIASVSTCLAVVGGLILSLSTNYAKQGESWKPQARFHVGRLIGFFILGGIVGQLGAVFQLGPTGYFILNLIVGIVMLILGINLLDIFHFTKKLQPSLPKGFGKLVLSVQKNTHQWTPFLLGAVTFFLPCGFTQAMQIQALSLESFWKGGLTMLLFALGTFPVLALLSFGAAPLKNGKRAGIFFKTAGLIVIVLALFNILNGFVAKGMIPPLFNF
ncbi:MAG: sulfite exporter TauE/SafE family protein [Candidatus Gracilibacteria bacterium]